MIMKKQAFISLTLLLAFGAFFFLISIPSEKISITVGCYNLAKP